MDTSNISDPPPGFRHVPKTGVINVMSRARALGYRAEDCIWANLGQGAPETGHIDGIVPHKTEMHLDAQNQEYAPIAGLTALREVVARYYNRFYRQEKQSQYTYRNVCICPGGRAALSRIAACLGAINIGHFLPDYTAYEELLTIFRGFIPIPTPLESRNGYQFSVSRLKKEITSHGLSALLLSNPRNPTGQLIAGDELSAWARTAHRFGCTMIFDEFYSHYVYTAQPEQAVTVSAAEYIEDVNTDPVIIVDGLTKNWRLPGWRIGWIVGPEQIIENISSAGSFLDGGANQPLQHMALGLFDDDTIRHNTAVIQKHFRSKRDFLVENLTRMGIKIDAVPDGTFYVWGNLSDLPKSISSGTAFLDACLHEKTIVVPGVFFDVNPGKRRAHSRWQSYVRFSFGPDMAEIERGIAALQRVLAKTA